MYLRKTKRKEQGHKIFNASGVCRPGVEEPRNGDSRRPGPETKAKSWRGEMISKGGQVAKKQNDLKVDANSLIWKGKNKMTGHPSHQ